MGIIIRFKSIKKTRLLFFMSEFADAEFHRKLFKDPCLAKGQVLSIYKLKTMSEGIHASAQLKRNWTQFRTLEHFSNHRPEILQVWSAIIWC